MFLLHCRIEYLKNKTFDSFLSCCEFIYTYCFDFRFVIAAWKFRTLNKILPRVYMNVYILGAYSTVSLTLMLRRFTCMVRQYSSETPIFLSPMHEIPNGLHYFVSDSMDCVLGNDLFAFWIQFASYFWQIPDQYIWLHTKTCSSFWLCLFTDWNGSRLRDCNVTLTMLSKEWLITK